ncbi:MAG: ATP synthase F0 subunit B [Thermoanaerobaculales bacterium]|nr:ATP synthase F0 subunit B [Thermoanaerobaculales bacterium]
MKTVGAWIAVFVVLLCLAFLVDHGETKLGVPVFLWLALNLTLFLYLLARFVGRPVSAFLDARQESIGTQLELAKTRLQEAEELKQEVAKRLASVENEVSAMAVRAEEQGRAEAARLAEEGAAEEERFLRRVSEEIERRGAETREQLARETTKLTTKIARALLEKEMTEADRARVLERSVTALQAMEEK